MRYEIISNIYFTRESERFPRAQLIFCLRKGFWEVAPSIMAIAMSRNISLSFKNYLSLLLKKEISDTKNYHQCKIKLTMNLPLDQTEKGLKHQVFHMQIFLHRYHRLALTLKSCLYKKNAHPTLSIKEK